MAPSTSSPELSIGSPQTPPHLLMTPTASPQTTPTPSPSSSQTTPTPSPPHKPPHLLRHPDSDLPYLSFNNPAKLILSEMNFNVVDYLKEFGNWSEIHRTPPSVIRNIILNPKEVPEFWVDLKMLTDEGKLIPAHLPQFSDLQFLSPAERAVLIWGMDQLEREGAMEVVPKEFERIVDPPPMLPQEIMVVHMDKEGLEMEAFSFDDAIAIVKTKADHKHIQLHLNWTSSAAYNDSNLIAFSLNPRTWSLYNPGLVQDLLPLPAVESNATFLYWNTRGIARPCFQSNLRFLIEQHAPHMVILSELRVSKRNAQEIAGDLPFDEWICVEPVGFSGGLLMLWRTDYISFETVRKDPQGCHGIVRGTMSADFMK